MEAKKKRSYYSKHLDELERIELKNAAAIDGIDEEIALLRFEIQQLIKDKSADPEELTKYVNTLCRSLVTRHAIGDDKKHELRNAIKGTLLDIATTFGTDMAKNMVDHMLNKR